MADEYADMPPLEYDMDDEDDLYAPMPPVEAAHPRPTADEDDQPRTKKQKHAGGTKKARRKSRRGTKKTRRRKTATRKRRGRKHKKTQTRERK